MKKGGIIAGVIILIIIIGAAGIIFFTRFNKPVKILKGDIGGEKKDFLADEEVKKILKNKYHYEIDYHKKGSIVMIREEISSDKSFLWPSSQVVLEFFKMNHSSSIKKSEIIFNSPIVLYSWDEVTEALINEGIVKKIDNSYYIVDFPRLIDSVLEGRKWSDIGLTQLNGKISIISTDPTKSNSGNMFFGLLANLINNNEVVTNSTVSSVLPKIKTFYESQGFMQDSSSKLFNAYLTQQMGSYPIIVGYESQAIEFALQYPDIWKNAKNKIRILYPKPTVWSAHPIIILKDDAKDLITALKDEEIQKLAWEKHGFRTGLQNDPGIFEITGIPQSITNVTNMPKPEVMMKIVEALEQY